MIYEWDPLKAAENLQKHGVSFEEAISVFLDPFALTYDDPDHSSNESRFITIGMSTQHRLLFVAHADWGPDRVRIISARRTTSSESHDFQERRTKSQR